MRPHARTSTTRIHGLLAGVLAAVSATSAPAATYDMSEVPLFLGGVVEPNIMFTIDDSGSMAWSFVPDSIENDHGHPRGLAARWNALAYDPFVDYFPPYRGDTATRFDNSPFTAAWDDGYAHEYGDGSCPNETVNLSTSYRPTWYFADDREQYSCDSYNRIDPWSNLPEYWGSTSSTRPAGQHAFYYVHYWDYPGTIPARPAGCDATAPDATTPDDDADDDDCYVRVVVAGGTGGIAANDRSTAEEQQNFANWYSYYRKRTMAAKAGIGNAFSQLGTRFRVGFGRINSRSATVDGVSTGGVLRGVRLFTDTARDEWFDYLFRTRAEGGTPLRRAADDAGRYFSRTDDRNPWVDDPADTTPPSDANTTAVECRKSFQLLMSDGYWNETYNSNSSYRDYYPTANGNHDGEGSTSWTGTIPNPVDPTSTVSVAGGYTPYTPGAPFSDGNTNTLADVAMYYWKRDLQPDVPNEVRPVYGVIGADYDDSFATPDPLIKQPRNPAFWQHLVSYTIAFGLTENTIDHVDPCCAFEDIANERPAECTAAVLASCPPLVWPTPGADLEQNLDDMLHAAVNSRGGFLNARDPKELEAGLIGILSGIVPEDATAASVVLNSGVARTDSLLYQALFTTDNWQGELRAFRILTSSDPTVDGNVGAEEWSTTDANKIPAWGSRRIATHNGTSAVPFQWASLSTAQREAIEFIRAGRDTSLVLNYLRGDQTCENRNVAANSAACQYSDRVCREVCSGPWWNRRCRTECTTTSTGVVFRDRNYPHANYVLGDITNSAPAYVGTPAGLYGTFDPTYGAFKTANSGDGTTPARTPMLYVGANDGMLHAFKAGLDAQGGGTEVFAYVPSMVVRNLSLLSSRSYSHRYYVDGTPVARDWCQSYDASNSAICASSGNWRTALVGGLGAGGQGIYALDVTSATVNSEADVAAKVMWEFSDRNTASSGLPNGDPDLGYTFSQPSIVRMQDGYWYAVFGNGYDNTQPDGSVSTTGNAALYFVRLGGSDTTSNGRRVQKIDTGVGMSADPAPDPVTGGHPNGLSTPVVVDVDNDFKADYVYAGDLFGNLWKFDVRSTNPSNWDVAYKNGTTNLPVFQATSAGGGLQPITTRPQVARHPSGNGLIVMFGTGKYFEVGDNRSAGQETQSVYGIWDRPNVPPTASREVLRDHLLEQTIDYELAVNGVGYRGTSANTLVWFVKPLCTTGVTPPACDTDGLPVTGEGNLGWFMDLDSPDSGANRGERQVSEMLLRGDKLIFTTLLPLDDACAFGGDGWLMEIDAESGGRLGYSPFDVNGDGLFTTSDLIDFDGAGSGGGADPAVAASGRKSGVGIIPTPAILARGAGDATKYVAGSKGGLPVGVRNIDKHLGRQSWQQLLR